MRARHRGVIAGATALVLVIAAVVLVVLLRGPAIDGAVASSHQRGHEPSRVLPGESGEWRSDGQTAGAWVELHWQAPVELTRVVVDQPSDSRITAGYVRFSDGSRVQFRLDGSQTVIPIEARQVDAMRFTVTAVQGDGDSVALTSLDADSDLPTDESVQSGSVLGGEIQRQAIVLGAEDATALTDRDPSTSTAVETSFQLTWDRPRELTSVALGGSPTGAPIRGATLTFSDGSTMRMGAVERDTARPTVLAFMPRVTTFVRVSLEVGPATGGPELSGVAVRERGALPVTPLGGTGATDDTSDTGAGAGCASPGARPDGSAVVVLCPTNGADVDDEVSLVLSVGPEVTQVGATPWSAQEDGPIGVPARGDIDTDGVARLALDVSRFPAGPFVVRVATVGGAGKVSTAFLQLVHHGSPPTSEAGAAPAGRTLVYEDDFDEPVAASRSGEGEDYAAAKPTSSGEESFGDAPFADPAEGQGNVETADGLLRLGVQPSGAGYTGAMIASARSGGSGFAAQYGYFEARMLLPAEPGTWPAFWLLPTPNLVAPTSYVAEIDAVEHYGHDPTSTCSTTHQYPDPDGIGEAHCAKRWDSDRQALSWHTFGVDVRPAGITYYIDDRMVAQAPQVKGGGDPMFFMLDLALGGGWPVDLSATRGRVDLYVDWVRVYV